MIKIRHETYENGVLVKTDFIDGTEIRRTQAKFRLQSTDIVINRIIEGVSLGLTSFDSPDVVEWMELRRSLRRIVGGSDEDMPMDPVNNDGSTRYPDGT